MEPPSKKTLLIIGASALAVGGFVLWSRRASAKSLPAEETGFKKVVVGKLPTPPTSSKAVGGVAPTPGTKLPPAPGSRPLSEQDLSELVEFVRMGPGGVMTWNEWSDEVADVARSRDLGDSETLSRANLLPRIKSIAAAHVASEQKYLNEDIDDIFFKTWKKPGKDKTFFDQLTYLLRKKERKEAWSPLIIQTSGVVAQDIYETAVKTVSNLPLIRLNAIRAVRESRGAGKISRDEEEYGLYTGATSKVYTKLGIHQPAGAYGDLTAKLRSKMVRGKAPIRGWFREPVNKTRWAGLGPGMRKRVFDTAVYYWPTAVANYIREWSQGA